MLLRLPVLVRPLVALALTPNRLASSSAKLGADLRFRDQSEALLRRVDERRRLRLPRATPVDGAAALLGAASASAKLTLRARFAPLCCETGGEPFGSGAVGWG